MAHWLFSRFYVVYISLAYINEMHMVQYKIIKYLYKYSTLVQKWFIIKTWQAKHYISIRDELNVLSGSNCVDVRFYLSVTTSIMYSKNRF